MRVLSALPNLGDTLGQTVSPFVILTHCLRSVQVLETVEPRTDEDFKNVVEVTWMLNKFLTNEHYPELAKRLF